jgi:very-short-patch-repair endonuclease
LIIFNTQDTREKRKVLRKDQTEAEKMLWKNLRNRRFHGFKFIRQYGIGHYIADFYCSELKLAIEVDGKQHLSKDRTEYDKERENYFTALGIKTIRFSNENVLKNMETVLAKIGKPSPSLSKRGTGELLKANGRVRSGL